MPEPISSGRARRSFPAAPALDCGTRFFQRIPLTSRGGAFSLLAIGLFCAGAIRSELGALLSGAGLLSSVLLALFGTLAEGRRCRRVLAANPEPLAFFMGVPLRDAEGACKAAFRVDNLALPSPRAPGIEILLDIRLRARNGRMAHAAVPLPARGTGAEGSFPSSGGLSRGAYRGSAALEVCDVFGFCAVRVEAVRSLEAVAAPEPKGAAVFVRGGGGERPRPSERVVQGEDRFDSRPYVPGDDPRRVHWKLYARFGDLFVRPGDLSPPPGQAVCVLVDTGRPEYMSGPEGQVYLDDLAAWALGCACLMRDRGTRVVCSSPGLPDAPEDEAGMAGWFADLAWTEKAPAAEVPGPERLVVFGAPGGTGIRSALAARKAPGPRCMLAIPGLPEEPSRPWAERFFLLPPADRKPGPGRAFRAAFSSALKRDVEELGGREGVDVRIL